MALSLTFDGVEQSAKLLRSGGDFHAFARSIPANQPECIQHRQMDVNERQTRPFGVAVYRAREFGQRDGAVFRS